MDCKRQKHLIKKDQDTHTHAHAHYVLAFDNRPILCLRQRGHQRSNILRICASRCAIHLRFQTQIDSNRHTREDIGIDFKDVRGECGTRIQRKRWGCNSEWKRGGDYPTDFGWMTVEKWEEKRVEDGCYNGRPHCMYSLKNRLFDEHNTHWINDTLFVRERR